MLQRTSDSLNDHKFMKYYHIYMNRMNKSIHPNTDIYDLIYVILGDNYDILFPFESECMILDSIEGSGLLHRKVEDDAYEIAESEDWSNSFLIRFASDDDRRFQVFKSM